MICKYIDDKIEPILHTPIFECEHYVDEEDANSTESRNIRGYLEQSKKI